jgi:hypothetical protein
MYHFENKPVNRHERRILARGLRHRKLSPRDRAELGADLYDGAAVLTGLPMELICSAIPGLRPWEVRAEEHRRQVAAEWAARNGAVRSDASGPEMPGKDKNRIREFSCGPAGHPENGTPVDQGVAVTTPVQLEALIRSVGVAKIWDALEAVIDEETVASG